LCSELSGNCNGFPESTVTDTPLSAALGLAAWGILVFAAANNCSILKIMHGWDKEILAASLTFYR
jgi:hypothetical protein